MDRNQAKRAVHDAISEMIRQKAAGPDLPIETIYANHAHIESNGNDVCMDLGEIHVPQEGGSVVIPRMRIYLARPFFSKLLALMQEHETPREQPIKKEIK